MYHPDGSTLSFGYSVNTCYKVCFSIGIFFQIHSEFSVQTKFDYFLTDNHHKTIYWPVRTESTTVGVCMLQTIQIYYKNKLNKVRNSRFIFQFRSFQKLCFLNNVISRFHLSKFPQNGKVLMHSMIWRELKNKSSNELNVTWI